MAAPTTYTEPQLALFVLGELGPLASALSYTVPVDNQGNPTGVGSFGETVNETLLEYGVDAITDISGRESIQKLRALARVQVWRQVVRATAGDFDFSADGQSFHRSDVQKMALDALSIAESDAMKYGGSGYAAELGPVVHTHDPYQWLPDQVRGRP